MDQTTNEWETVTFRKKPTLKTAQCTGRVTAVAKTSGKGATNRKLDAATGEDGFKHSRVSKSFAQALQRARLAKKMTQKDLATKIHEKPQVVMQYETGKAIPQPAIVQKLSRALGCQLPRCR